MSGTDGLPTMPTKYLKPPGARFTLAGVAEKQFSVARIVVTANNGQAKANLKARAMIILVWAGLIV